MSLLTGDGSTYLDSIFTNLDFEATHNDQISSVDSALGSICGDAISSEPFNPLSDDIWKELIQSPSGSDMNPFEFFKNLEDNKGASNIPKREPDIPLIEANGSCNNVSDINFPSEFNIEDYLNSISMEDGSIKELPVEIEHVSSNHPAPTFGIEESMGKVVKDFMLDDEAFFNDMSPSFELEEIQGDDLQRTINETDLSENNFQYPGNSQKEGIIKEPILTPFCDNDLYIKEPITDSDSSKLTNALNFDNKNVPLIGVSRVKYSNVQHQKLTNNSQTVCFATYSAERSKSQMQNTKNNIVAKMKGKAKGKKDSRKLKRKQRESKIILPVGKTGCVASIPALSFVNMHSFCCRQQHGMYDNDPMQKTNPQVDSKNKLPINSGKLPIYRNSYYIKNQHGNLGTNCDNVYSQADFLVNSLKQLSAHKNQAKKGGITYHLALNKQTADPKKKRMSCFTKVSKTDTSDILCSIKREFQCQRAWPMSVKQRLEKIIKVLKKNIYFLTEDILNQMSIPIKAVRRGSLSSRELTNLKMQAYFIHKLKKDKGTHENCLSQSCHTCTMIRKFHCILNGDSNSDLKLTLFRNFSETRTSSALNQGGTIQESSLKVQERMYQDQIDERCTFSLNGLSIGRVSIMADEMHDVVNVKFLKECFVYEVELQCESLIKMDGDMPLRKSFFIVMEINCSSVCGIQLEKTSEIRLLVSNIPNVKLLSAAGFPLSEKALSLDPFQISLLASLRCQLALNPIHKLFFAGHIEFFKKRLLKGCPWLRSSIEEISGDDRLIESLSSKNSQETQDRYILRSLPRVSAKAATNCVPNRASAVCSKKGTDPPSFEKPMVINIYSRDPFVHPVEPKVDDGHVWIENHQK